MGQKSVLITGCSSGIGYDAAHGLKARGWRVFATCRQEKDCERLRDEGLESLVLDYTDAKGMKAALDEVLIRTNGTLSALYNNGAYGMAAACEDLTTDALRAMFETNFFGYHELTNLVIPVMRAQGHGRIVNCSSVLGLAAIRWRGAYTATKFALEGLTDTLRLELLDTPIQVSLIEPGPVTSDFRKKSIQYFERWVDWENSVHREVYEEKLLKRLYDAPTGPEKFELPASAVTKKLVHALEAARPRPRYYVTTPTYIAGALKRLLPTRMQDMLLRKS